MAKIGQINTVITSNANPLTMTLNKAASAIGGFRARVAGMAGAIGPLLAPIAGLTAAIKGVMVVSQEFGNVDSIAKYARATGQTVDEVVGLQHAASLTGVQIGALEAAQKRALRQGMSLDAIADEIAAVESPIDRARIAYEKLGRQGQQIMPFLSQGGNAIRDMMAEGAALSGFNMADAMKVEEANDAWTRMQAIFTGITRDLVIALAPGIKFVSDQMQALGKLTRQAFSAITPMIVQFSNLASTAFTTVKGVAQSAFGDVVKTGIGIFTTIRDFFLDAMIVGEFAFNNIGEIADLAWSKMKLFLVQVGAEFMHTFTERIPKTLLWFADNWQDIFFTAVDYALTVLINLGGNIRKVWTGVIDFIAGRGFSVDFTPLTEGFVNTIKEFPQIGEREISATEKALSDSVNKMQANIGDKLSEFTNQRRNELFGSGDVVETRANFEMEDVGETIANKIGEVAGPQALQRGSAEAFSAIFSAMRGDSVQDKMLATADATLKETRKQTRQIEQMAARAVVELVVAEI